MTVLLNMLIVNAIVAVPLAGIAWCVSRWGRRPALTHMLWVIVLLKLVTPPFFKLPYSISIPIETASSSVSHEEQLETPAFSATDDSTASSEAALPFVNRTETSPSEAADVGIASPPVQKASSLASVPTPFERCQTLLYRCLKSPQLISVGLAIWCLGALVWFVTQFACAFRFWKVNVRDAADHELLQHQTEQLAKRFGLRRSPRVRLIQSQMSPMLWGYGPKLQLLFPSDLLRRLDHDSRGTLLAHELAHYARGDHWIRGLELFVTGLFWWHPVVWAARRQIEESEEECCDAWVVTKLPDPPRRYAEALLDTIDFLCDTSLSLPPLASGLGPAPFIRRRLTRIMKGVLPRELPAWQRYSIAAVALCGLPLQPFVFGFHSTLKLPSLSPPKAQPVMSAELEPSSPAPEPIVDLVESTPAKPAFPPLPIERSKRSARGERVLGTAVSSDGHFAVHVTTARRVLLSNLATNEETTLSATDLTSVAFFPDCLSFASGGSNGQVTIWSAVTGEAVRTLYTHDDAVRSVAVAPTGKTVAVGGRNGSVLIVDVGTKDLVAELSRADAAVNCIRFSPDGRRLAVAVGDWNSSEPGHVAIWNLETGRADSVLGCETAPGAISFVSNNELIVGQWNGQTSLWNLVSRQIVGSANPEKSVVNAAAFSPDNPALREVAFVAPGKNSDFNAVERFDEVLLNQRSLEDLN